MSRTTQIEDFKKEEFSFKLRNNVVAKHDIYSLGSGNKIVVIIQELPGIGQETLALADRFVEQGYRVFLPHLFGPIGRTAAVGNLFRVLCMRQEFKIFAKNESSPIVDFLSSLCSYLKAKHSVKGVAVIGMCLTGNFAISLMANEDVLAGFASQPSMAVLSQESLHMSSNEISKIKNNIDKVGAMHCGSFEKDKLCTYKKIQLLDKTFNEEDRKRIIFHQLPGKGHAILTLDFIDKEDHPTHKTLKEIFAYFDKQLSS
ncbi:MAG: dienelactone hydrolase family protein [Chitinophagales bacterium]